MSTVAAIANPVTELKLEFTRRGLDLRQVWQPTPGQPDLECRQLEHLLNWVRKYETCRDRQAMAAAGYECPPVEPDVDPETDWLRFERWMTGRSTTCNLRHRLQQAGLMPEPDDVTDEAIRGLLPQIRDYLRRKRVELHLPTGIPGRLAYEFLFGELSASFDLTARGTTTHIDGCGGFCPDCFQRPWCENGRTRWDEDEDAGYMVFPERIRPYVNVVPTAEELDHGLL